MAEYLIQGETLDDIADAINAKTGGSSAMTPAQMVTAIGSIQTGTGEWTTDRIATNSEPSGALTINVASISQNAFNYKTGITSINCPTVTSIGNAAFLGCNGITNVNLPLVSQLGNNAFRYCRFSTIVLPSISSRLDGAVFENCSQLQTADFGISCPTIEQYCFSGCSNLATLVIRKNGVPSVSTNAFNGTKFASNGTGGTLYVPQAQIAAYQAATNWSVILGYANNRILPIEGSIYETKYADGTPIPTT